jgi:hypothetical protein
MMAGAAITAWNTLDRFGFADFVAFDHVRAEFLFKWDWWLAGAVAGGVLGAFGWILSRPRTLLTRRIPALVGINWATWVVFLVFTPQVEAARFEQIAGRRAVRDRGGSITGASDQPTILAARYIGGFRGIAVPELSLMVMAGIPATIAELYVVSPRYVGSPPTRGESYVIAGIAFVLSTAFWITISRVTASLWTALRRGWPPATLLQPASGTTGPDGPDQS